LTQSPEKQVTIALISSYPLHVGGVETHLLSLLRHGDRSRYRWLMIGPLSPAFAAQAEAAGAQIIEWRPRHFADLISFFALARLLRQRRVGVAHFHCPRSAFLGRVLARPLRIPAVVTVHLPAYYFAGSRYTGPRFGRWLYLRLERVLNRRLTARLIYVSSLVLEEAIALRLVSRRRAEVISNGVDLSRYDGVSNREALRAGAGLAAGDKVICFIGRLDHQKGIDILLDAVSGIDLAAHRARLWLIGDGPLRGQLQQQARQSGRAQFISFLGFRDDVPCLLKASDVFVLPSRYEAMPLAILEAMAAGLPCVVTDTGENSRLVTDGVSGLVVSSENTRALAEALRQLLEDPARCLTMGRAARERAEDFSDTRMVQKIQGVYETIRRPQHDF